MIERPNLRDLNAAIACNISSVLAPKYSACGRGLCSLNTQFSHLCAHAGFKFMDVKCLPQVHYNICSFNLFRGLFIFQRHPVGRLSIPMTRGLHY